MMHRLGSVFLPVVQGDVDRQWRLRTDNCNFAFLGVEGLSYSGGVCVFPLIFTLHGSEVSGNSSPFSSCTLPVADVRMHLSDPTVERTR